MEHRLSGEQCQHCKDRDSNLPFQAYLERRQYKAAKRRHSDHVPKGRLPCGHIGRKGYKKCETGLSKLSSQCYVETNSNRHGDAHKHGDRHRKSGHYSARKICSDVIRTDVHKPCDLTLDISPNENIPLKDFNSDNSLAEERHKEDNNATKDELMQGNTRFNDKRPLKYTASDPTCNRPKLSANARDYVGYNVIENFLKDSSFGSDLNVKSKTVRSNSEPGTSAGMTERLKNSLFIDAFDDKSKSLENLNVNNTYEARIKVMDKESPRTSKRQTPDYKPIEAYKELGLSKVKSLNSSPVQQDDQIPTTSKLSQSSLYQV